MKTNKQSGRKGGVALSSKAIKRPTRSKQVLSDKESLEDLVEFLEGLPALTFVLYSPGISSYGPTLISALDMMSNASNVTSYSGPLPESEFAAAKVEAARRYEEITESVWTRMMQLRDKGVSCVLYWHAFGDADQNCVPMQHR